MIDGSMDKILVKTVSMLLGTNKKFLLKSSLAHFKFTEHMIAGTFFVSKAHKGFPSLLLCRIQ